MEIIIQFCDKYNGVATIFLTAIATYIAVKQFRETRGHKLKVTYPYSSSIYEPEIYIPYVYVYNEKNKTEIITEILLEIGADCVLLLKTFEEPIILNPMEMKKVILDKVSFYGVECNIITNMNEIFNNKKIKKIIIFNTPLGIIKPSILKHCPENLNITMAFKNNKRPVYLGEWKDKNGNIINHRTKYIGEIYKDNKHYERFYIYKDGSIISHSSLFIKNKIDINILVDIAKTKDVLENIFKFKKDDNYTINIEKYEYENQLKLENTQLNVCNLKIKFAIIKLLIFLVKK